MSNEFRPHVVMGIIILILALALIVLSFVPKHAQYYQAPKGQIPSFSQQASAAVLNHSSLE